MEKVKLCCKCNNQEELVKCLTLLKGVGITWPCCLRINIKEDASRLNYGKPIIICLNQRGKGFVITYSSNTKLKYGYNTLYPYADDVTYFIVNFKKFTEAINRYYRAWKK